MIALGRALSQHFNIFFLSNTDPLHIPVLYDHFPDLLFFHGEALSYQLGALKPEAAFYERALEKFSLNPGECLFIDDLAENVTAARQLGLRSIRHTTPAETKSAVLSELEREGFSLDFKELKS